MQQPIYGYGLCQCGCGQKTELAKYTNRRYDVVKGEPRNFIHCHSLAKGPGEFWRRIPTGLGVDECWPWPGPFDRAGYGAWGARKVHRIMCEHTNGPAPERCALHSCDNPPCCNPAHLRWGTQAENVDGHGRSWSRLAPGRQDHG